MKIVTIVGARPQFIKAAPVSRAIEEHNLQGKGSRIAEILVHTGQHYDYSMNQVFFEQLELCHPKYNLGVGSGKHGEMTGAMFSKIEAVLINEKPDWVLVYGDTNSTLAGALAAIKSHIPVAHVEAGLRSFNRRMPEEINRVVTDHISNILFCPTDTAVLNLEKEGITSGVLNIGDVMYDAFLFNKTLSDQKSTILADLELRPGSYCLATIHRQENTESPVRLNNIFAAFGQLADASCPFIVPLHPRTLKSLRQNKIAATANPHVRLIPPVSYLDMIAVETQARVILTDSGGVQKEAYFCQVPCVTMRDETEWTETVEAGWNHLSGANLSNIIGAFQLALNSGNPNKDGLYGKGGASQLILSELLSNAVKKVFPAL